MIQTLSKSKPISAPRQTNTNVLPSALVSSLLDKINSEERLVVLDMGPAISSTVKYFSQYKCRLNFIDLYSEDFVLSPEEEMSHSQIVSLMRGALRLHQSAKIDICLFWDIFSYLSDSLLSALIEALEEYIDSSTRAFIINSRDSRTDLPFYHYGLDSPSNLTQSQRRGDQPRLYPRSQRVFYKKTSYHLHKQDELQYQHFLLSKIIFFYL